MRVDFNTERVRANACAAAGSICEQWPPKLVTGVDATLEIVSIHVCYPPLHLKSPLSTECVATNLGVITTANIQYKLPTAYIVGAL